MQLFKIKIGSSHSFIVAEDLAKAADFCRDCDIKASAIELVAGRGAGTHSLYVLPKGCGGMAYEARRQAMPIEDFWAKRQQSMAETEAHRQRRPAAEKIQ